MLSKDEIEAVAEKPEYLLVKRGLYYRPDNCGYTGIKDNAGRYNANEAQPDCGVHAIHEGDAPLYAPACFHDLAAKHFAEKVQDAAANGPLVKRYADALIALLAGFPDGHGLTYLQARTDGASDEQG